MDRVRAVLGTSVGPLGPSWGHSGRLWGRLSSRKPERVILLKSMKKVVNLIECWPHGGILEPSWAVLGVSWAVLTSSRSVLRSSWTILEAYWAKMEASWAVFDAIMVCHFAMTSPSKCLFGAAGGRLAQLFPRSRRAKPNGTGNLFGTVQSNKTKTGTPNTRVTSTGGGGYN